MGKTKKQFDERLQEIRTKHDESLRYRKRKQQEEEAEEELKEYNKYPAEDE